MPIGNLSVGAFGDEVRDVHNKLRQHGFDLPAAEVERNFYGPGTRDTITEFQQKYGLKVTGVVDAATQVALKGAASTLARQPAATQSAASSVAEPGKPAGGSNGSNSAPAGRSNGFSAPTNGNHSQSNHTRRAAEYGGRDEEARVSFYVPLWKRKGISLESFDDYWRDVHGPVCARLPGQFQYWQFHLAHNEGGIFPSVAGVDYSTTPEDQFDGIAELTFRSEAERQTWFEAAGILMDDEHNIFSKAIGYVTEAGNSQTYVDGIELGDPNGNLEVIKFHVLVRQAAGVSSADFRRYLREEFAAQVVRSPQVLKFRLHLFEPPDVSRPDAAGVVHYEPPEKQYQAGYEIGFRNKLAMEQFFASAEYGAAVREQGRYVKQMCPFPERAAYTFVYQGQMTLAGQRGSRTAALITELGATNQLRPDIHNLVVGNIAHSVPMVDNGSGRSMAVAVNGRITNASSNNGGSAMANTNGRPVQTKGRINHYQDLAADYSTPEPVPKQLGDRLIRDAERFIAMKERQLPELSPQYTLEQIERENKEWWPSHCEALRRGRGDLLTDEYHENLVYFCQDGPYYGLDEQKEREKHWWALIAQPGVTMTWPIVMFHGEFVWFEWACMDDTTRETIAKGSVSWVRRGHRGGCYFKGEQLTFYRDVFASPELLRLITT